MAPIPSTSSTERSVGAGHGGPRRFRASLFRHSGTLAAAIQAAGYDIGFLYMLSAGFVYTF